MIWNRSDLTAWTSAHFKAKEFECSCGICSRQVADDRLIKLLEDLRVLLNMPIRINSGFRCANKQQQLRNAGYETAVGTSTHEMGQAADLSCDDMAALRVACETIFGKFSIGTAHSFIHVDIRAGGPRRWGYTKS